ncbi:cysteine protease StiP family protein [Urbifossiella limnaea]|uniref:Cysteine protease StiP n=1 Tax=Urbifossiella limnaea TaxID=2528023 RepID=A0A517XPN3_9BACT|nr:cysteine protease StiP family protein [Urbifossiella limnaea]QDU19463.1 Cysteine protease StiP precursor [Urbifossiella limnaea]
MTPEPRELASVASPSHPFSGSYDPADVTFLLKPVRLAPTPVAEKERLIQSGARHYSEMISAEKLPSAAYLEVFRRALARNKARFAADVLTLAARLAERPGGVTLVSLARAGTPVGVLLARALHAPHYSVSIIRDRGIDEVALRFILERHPAASVVFVDGWTGKGVIARELAKAVAAFNARTGAGLDGGLWAVADLCGAAAVAATADDYLIPSAVLGATVSGLVSRSILNADVVGPGDFHGCLFLREFAPHDLSRAFVDEVFAAMTTPTPPAPIDAAGLRQRSAAFLAAVRDRTGVRDENHVKPGIGEATRVLLRRVPDRVLVRDQASPDVEHLLVLAREKGVPVEVDAGLPYAAAALIKELDG